MNAEGKRYRAFISYSQRDKKAATRLHRALETYRLPTGLTQNVDPKSRRLGRFFRDDDEMGAATDLGAALRGAIADADNLIVICSPSAARSHWVNEEVVHFKRTGRADCIFAVIVEGVPRSSKPEYECFPPALLFELGEDGTPGDQPAEPLALDIRKEPFPRMLTRLVAGVIRTPFDALWRRERRRMRLRVTQLAFASLSSLLAVGLTGVGLVRANARSFSEGVLEASRHSNLTDEQAARFAVLASRETLFESAAPGASARLTEILAAADPYWVESAARSYEGKFALAEFTESGPLVFISDSNVAPAFGPPPNESAIRAINAATGERVETLPHHRWREPQVSSPDGTRAFRGDQVFDSATGFEVVRLVGQRRLLGRAAFSPDGSRRRLTGLDRAGR